MNARDTELSEQRELLALGIITQPEYEKRALAIARKHAMTTPAPAAAAEAAAAAAPVEPKTIAQPTLSAKEYAALSPEERVQESASSGIKPQPMPQPWDKQTGKPIPTSLSSITVRAAEDGIMVDSAYYDKRSRTTKTKKVYQGNGRPTGRLAIGINYNSKLSLSYVEFLQLKAKWAEICDAVESVVENCQPITIDILK